eukprot:904504-Amphidinium_carterae.1
MNKRPHPHKLGREESAERKFLQQQSVLTCRFCNSDCESSMVTICFGFIYCLSDPLWNLPVRLMQRTHTVAHDTTGYSKRV